MHRPRRLFYSLSQLVPWTTPLAKKDALQDVYFLAEPLQISMENGARRALIPLENKRNFLKEAPWKLRKVQATRDGNANIIWCGYQDLGGRFYTGICASTWSPSLLNHRFERFTNSSHRLCRWSLTPINRGCHTSPHEPAIVAAIPARAATCLRPDSRSQRSPRL